ncbi:unnamed protein product [Cuscuta campestris]|uniref:Uncharacterized protein n=1 Tax=Cuscuta campestris TaxID=132261 RepID=A0A484M6Y1_9ASTE|nr:unnamed protein product [Cuscuta campestris]
MFQEYPNKKGMLIVVIIQCDIVGSSSISVRNVQYHYSRSAIAAASVLPVSTARVSAAAAGAEEGSEWRSGAIYSVGLLLFNEEQGGPNLQERREWILILQKLNLTPDVVREALKNLEYKGMFGDRSIHIVEILGEILEKTTIFVDGEVALHGCTEMVLQLHRPGMLVVVKKIVNCHP